MLTRSVCMSRSASPVSKCRCSTRHPPAASVEPNAIAKLPDQKKPFALQVRTSGSSAKMSRHRQHSAPRRGARARWPSALRSCPKKRTPARDRSARSRRRSLRAAPPARGCSSGNPASSRRRRRAYRRCRPLGAGTAAVSICTSRLRLCKVGAQFHEFRGEIPADHRALEDEHRHIADAQLILELRPLGEGAQGDTGAAGHARCRTSR